MAEIKKIRDSREILGLLESGELAADLSAEIRTALEKLTEHAGDKFEAKGKITLTLNFNCSQGRTHIDADITSKMPKRKRRTSMFFVTEDGALSLEHPAQHDMFIRPVDGKSRAAGDN